MSDLIEKAINTRLNQSQNTDKPINAIVPQKETQPKPFLIPFAELVKDYQPPKWLVKEIIPEHGLVELFGASGSFKSFIALDIGYCISTGISWHGHDVNQGNVVYFAGEGHHGITKRAMALQKHYEKTPDSFFISSEAIDLSNEENLQEVSEYLKQISNVELAIIDTLHRNSGNINEDSASDFANVLKNIDKYLVPYAKVIMWVHHTGHGSKERSRGTSARYASLDACYLIKRDSNTNIVEMQCTKMKDAEEPEPLKFEMLAVETEIIDPDTNEQIRSLVPTKTDKAVSDTKNDKPLTPQQEDALRALRLAIKNDGRELPAEIKERENITEGRGVKREQWRDEAYKVIDVDSKGGDIKEAKRQAFNRAINELKKRDKVRFLLDYYFIPSDCKHKYQRDRVG